MKCFPIPNMKEQNNILKGCFSTHLKMLTGTSKICVTKAAPENGGFPFS